MTAIHRHYQRSWQVKRPVHWIFLICLPMPLPWLCITFLKQVQAHIISKDKLQEPDIELGKRSKLENILKQPKKKHHANHKAQKTCWMLMNQHWSKRKWFTNSRHKRYLNFSCVLKKKVRYHKIWIWREQVFQLLNGVLYLQEQINFTSVWQ